MTRKLDDAETKRRREVVAECDRLGLPRAEAARRLGIKPGTLNQWAMQEGVQPPEAVIAPVAEAQVTPRERHDAAFFRRQSADLQRSNDALEHLIEELAGVRGITPEVPEWLAPQDVAGSSRAVLLAHTSDLHYGERIDPGEIEGINRYDHETARDRMRRYFEAVCTIGPRWMAPGECDGVLLTMGGDLISGDIHEELMRTNGLTSHEQVQGVVEIYEAGIKMLLGHFERVHVVAVPGNHGRTTVKSTAKLASRLSYDILAASILKERMSALADRVTWSISTGVDVRVPLYGRTILVTHGDKIGTGGGQGFAGPVLPIIRGGNKVRLQSHSAGLGCDLILMGHYHTSAAPPGILANGSVPGYSEFGNMIRSSVEPPKQWLARFSLRWGLCETLAVRLDDPPAKARVRVHA